LDLFERQLSEEIKNEVQDEVNDDTKSNSSSDLEREEQDDKDWLRQSMEANMKNWADEINNINQISKQIIESDDKIEDKKSVNETKIDRTRSKVSFNNKSNFQDVLDDDSPTIFKRVITKPEYAYKAVEPAQGPKEITRKQVNIYSKTYRPKIRI
jgi:seryl-tRNA(Sec) selenium transferase